MLESPLSAEREARRRSILQAAIETFAQQGFAASRTRDIAARAGVAEGTIYLYFDSKDELLLTAFRDTVNEFAASLGRLLHDPRPFAERLTDFIASQFVRIEADPALATVLLFESRQSPKFYAGSVREVLRSYASEVEHLLSSGIDRGEVRDDLDIPLARRMLIGALEEVELNWLLSDRTRELTPLASRVASTFVMGLGRPGTAHA
jgi:TetR/AcrR family transcriptional regulator, fatty acid metabolism regulator protein